MHMKKLSQTEVEEILKESKIPVTVQRLSLVSFILQADHPTAEDVIKWATKNLAKVNTATVYNTLKTLEESGIIKKIKFPHLEHFVYDHNVSHHFHFLDESSGKIIDLEPEDIQVQHKLKGFSVTSVDVLLKGRKK